MKYLLKFLTFIFFSFFMISCKEKPLSDIERQAFEQNEATSSKSSIKMNSDDESSEKVDINLSEMNSNLVYAEVFNMMIEPEFYIDKSIKMRGKFVIDENSPTANGGKFYAVLINDALACCKQGIEFKYDFGENEPNEGDVITVTGIYKTDSLPDDVAFNYVKAEKVEFGNL